MKTYIALLRGVNVNGRHLIKMDALRQLCEGLGFFEVQSYIQSGNLVFNTTKVEVNEIESEIKDAIAKVFGIIVPVLVIELTEFKTIVQQNPFVLKGGFNEAYLHITFFSSVPSIEELEKLKSDFDPDQFIILNQAIYLYCPNGYGKTKLTNSYFEKKLKVTTTTRNWNTICILLQKGEETSIK